jgi:hypothetical protein
VISFVVVVAAGQLLAVVGFLLVGGYGLWSWAKFGLLTILLSLRADVVATARGAPVFSDVAELPITVHVRFVPMVLTIGFLVLAARAGRRAARAWSAPSPLVTAGLAALGAAAPVAILAAIAASLVTLSFSIFDLHLQVDVVSAACWAAFLAAAGAGTGAYLEAAPSRAPAAALRGGLVAYAWALGLLAVGVFVIATLEPTVTRDYVDEIVGLGTGGSVAIGYHVLAIPAQSALLLAPAAGSCVEFVSEGSVFELCPWHVVASGPVGELFVPDAVALSPWLWLLSVAPVVAAFLGGWRAAVEATVGGWRAAAIGATAGVVFASLTVIGGWLVAPRLSSAIDPAVLISLHPAWARTVLAALSWGVVGGAIGGRFAGRAYDPEPRPTSA